MGLGCDVLPDDIRKIPLQATIQRFPKKQRLLKQNMENALKMGQKPVLRGNLPCFGITTLQESK